MMKKMGLWAVFVVLGVSLLGAQQKYALVIGNGAYTGITRLNNPVNDAADISAVLRGLGFTVDQVTNAGRVQMEEGVTRLRNRLSAAQGSYGFFYYAGHGVQSGSENYLIPVDANIPSEAYLRDRSVSMQAVLGELNAAGNGLNIVVLDACRDNPFSWSQGRGGARGLQVVGSQPADSIIVYATSAGSTAADGTGRNGLFTTHLLNNLKKPGLEVSEMFRLTGADVRRASGGGQIPAIYSQFFEVAYLGTRPSVVTPDPRPVPVQPVAPPVVNPQPAPANMVRVEGGTFQMGSTNGASDEKPVHTVTVKGFYMGKTEVTQKEWREIMGNNPSFFKGDNLPVEQVSWNEVIEFCNRLSLKEGLTPAYRGSGNNITCDFNATGYRLPTEAEWEYAAKGGNQNYLTYEYSGGNSADSVAWYDGNSGGKTHPVGTKQPNSLGLYDMSGNVWEWCWDWYGGYSSGNQTDPTGVSSGTGRVSRGGGWGYGAASVRAANRSNYTPSGRDLDLGFRLVRP
ncbi:MAG: SUMF1/EgtB/PvdO family nonheme iron enzyme [Treponema sp.]|jgi:formylglycine-generating enzyme required for sulfatase activity|nr:SUMF1/EgtB/PvdO family nonheme iron enzyme [Treponema sp.]